jgi:predicted nucleic acid-binding protein
MLIPKAVLAELQSEAAPEPVKQWASQLPVWIDVAFVPASDDPLLSTLDRGEREAILLAETSHATLLVIDERKGTQAARVRGLETVGTLGLIARAHKRGWIDGSEVFERLIQTTSFRHASALREIFLASLTR